jgi:hypothetical protein
MIGSQLTKVFTILVISKDVVVATDQHFITVQATHGFQSSAVDDNIAQMIDFIIGTHTVVPPTDHLFVHFVGVVPGTQFGNPIVACEATYTRVAKVRVTN